jgi:ribose 5-phosphate isomerase A
LCRTRLQQLGCEPERRGGNDGAPLLTDNGNYILDCKIAPIENPAELERAILEIPGVVGTGLFVGLADVVVVRDGDSAEVLTRP